jgi:hypothetical protein
MNGWTSALNRNDLEHASQKIAHLAISKLWVEG